jgi:hypothetical protein
MNKLHKEPVITKKFSAIVNPNAVNEALPAGLVDGLIIILTDATKATLVLMRHIKDFVYVSEVSIIGNLQRHTP